MLVQFQINYRARWGQGVCLLVFSDEEHFEKYKMQCTNESEWSVELQFNDEFKVLRYRYGLEENERMLMTEFGTNRRIRLPNKSKRVKIIDQWRIPNGDSPFETIAFSEVFFKRKSTAKQNSRGELIIQLRCAQLEPTRHIAIVGNQEILGNWDVTKRIRLDETDFPVWSIALNVKELFFPLEYKYLVVDSKTNEVEAWELGANRRVEYVDSSSLTVMTDEHFVRTIPDWRVAGTAIPVFSLRSEADFGIGDFMDLKLLIDWAKQTGQRFIQILPINDTILTRSNLDSYPYNAVSVYALHPIYLRLERMGTPASKKDVTYFEKKKKELNDNPICDYQCVLNEKWKYFELMFEQESKTVFQSKDYERFFADNEEWLVPYAVFSYLRDKNGTSDFNKWVEYKCFMKEKVYALASPQSAVYNDIALYYFLQYHLHCQLIEVREYARSLGIALKSDVPIGVSPQSVDVWVEPNLFDSTMQAGAPPDDFSATGQNWGFPTYNWNAMAKDGYRWWKRRFRKFAQYFDAYRIDHILGFFRIWEIPRDDVWALTGNFNPALPFNVEELEALGLQWDEKRYLKPYITEHVVQAVFDQYAGEVIHDYLLPDEEMYFKFKPEFDTQRKIETHFASINNMDANKMQKIRDGLYSLHCEVIFVRDKCCPNSFHPRIGMHTSHAFRALNEEIKRILDQIYIDYFYRRHNVFWKEKAMEKLPALVGATSMLVCGEDLGMVPDSVPEVMIQLELLSLEILRMPKNPNTVFAMPADVPYLSVCTTSTHDMNPIRAWWEEDIALSQHFYNTALHLPGIAPESCTPLVAEKIIDQHLHSKAMLVILPWQDWLAIDEDLRRSNPHEERINVPSNRNHFWCYRLHLPLEQLIAEKKLNAKIKRMIEACGRLV